MIRFRTDEIAEVIRPLVRYRSLEDVFGRNPSAIRAVHSVLTGETETTTLKRVDLILCACGRPELLQLITEQ